MSAPKALQPGVYHAGPENHYLWGAGCDGWRLVRRPGLSLRRERMAPGAAETAHFHRHAHQIFCVLAGELTIWLPESGVLHAAPGAVIEIPPGVVHLVQNRGAGDLHLLLVSAPDTEGDRHPAALPEGAQ